jgi:predicted helicase
MNKALLNNYLRDIGFTYRSGNATEHTYRPNLKDLLEPLFPGITATNEPKRIKCGAPDFIITNKQTPLGYIETKDIGISLDQVERTDQMKRYLSSLANLILTDYLEFRWYVSGQLRISARLAKVGANNKLLLENGGVEKVADLLQGFILTQTPTVSNPRELAIRMAALAQLIRNAIHLAFESEEGGGSLHTQMQGFQQVLLPDLTYQQFADMYAQTICYGLFAARCNTKPGITFTREHAAYDIPKTNPFLRKMFNYIAGPNLDERIVWVVDDLAELLNRSDMAAILQDFGKRTRQEDPVVHFYETFLAQYDPKLRELRGVYYTPEPVVSYIVRSVDYLLKRDFDLAEGLADSTKLRAASADGKYNLETHKVQILDPATGTGTFLYYVVRQIYEKFKDNKGMWSSYVSEHLLPRLFGFEILMAPYAVAHLKLGLQLRETGYDFKDKERLGIYLTNTLEEEFEVGRLPFAEWLVEEATAAGNVKYDAPVMIVLGNPPYSNFGMMNTSEWILELLEDYKKDLEEKKLNLREDSIKFIRFGQWRINRTGYGILAFITNNTFIDGITHRRMRQSLMETFTDIYILNLHGSSKRQEQSPDGSKDENVFDIQQGVTISIFVKRPERKMAEVHYAELWGLREDKYMHLLKTDISTTQWTDVVPKPAYFFFLPTYFTLEEEYSEYMELKSIFLNSGSGVKTERDKVSIHWTEKEIMATVQDFRTLDEASLREKYSLGSDSRDWKVANAKVDVLSNTSLALFRPILYRPFDIKYTWYSGRTRGFIGTPGYPTMRHMLKTNSLALLSCRQQAELGFQHVFCSRIITECCAVSLKTREITSIFPLYLHPDATKNSLWEADRPTNASEVSPNLSPSFISAISAKLNMQFILDGRGDLQETLGPEDVFHYMYAVFHAPTYRQRYAEFLKRDFPRLPLTSNTDLFCQLCAIGNRLVGLHLLEQYGMHMPNYPQQGNNMVEKVEYSFPTEKPEQGRVWINKTQFFDGVPPEVWEFQVGGYKVCSKWLKDRKGRVLSFADIIHYQRIVANLDETITLMEKIDQTIDEYGGWPIT